MKRLGRRPWLGCTFPIQIYLIATRELKFVLPPCNGKATLRKAMQQYTVRALYKDNPPFSKGPSCPYLCEVGLFWVTLWKKDGGCL